ncbi:hypothetical protein HWV62_19757 [Athelia sp. TMB]|nr:hypothetical protein HWV62_19757 [Athelia sp. TMB]
MAPYKIPSPSHPSSDSSIQKTASAQELEHTDPSNPSDGGFASLAEGDGSGGEDGEGQGGAFNPVTGEINWDCPCLGGMAHGVCGAQFREAFSCFVFSEQEPKGIDCVGKFKNMQDCFREHPDIYGEEIMDDDEEEDDVSAETPAAVEVPNDEAPSSEKSEGSLPQTQSV